MAYQPDGQEHLHPAPVCLFYVAAHGPGDPKTRAIELNGARCNISEDGRLINLSATSANNSLSKFFFILCK